MIFPNPVGVPIPTNCFLLLAYSSARQSWSLNSVRPQVGARFGVSSVTVRLKSMLRAVCTHVSTNARILNGPLRRMGIRLEMSC